MSKIIKDVCVVVETYKKNGVDKKRYQKVGVAFIDLDGTVSIKLDKFFNPAGIVGDCWLNLFDKKESTPF